MKPLKISYWIVTVLLSAFIVVTAIPDVTMNPGAVIFFEGLLLPPYLLPIIGWGKILGVIGILQRKWPFLREWAYAGLMIDLVGALLSHVSTNSEYYFFIPGSIGLVLTLASYVLLRKAYGDKARLAALAN